MARANRINKLFQEFIDNLNGKTIASYFQIDHSTYTFSRLDDSTFEFKVRNESFPKCVFEKVPIELSMKIIGFLYQCTCVTYHITFPADYPFKPPQWNLQTILAPQLYVDALHVLTHQYDNSWSPAISIEKDILNMIHCIESVSDGHFKRLV